MEVLLTAAITAFIIIILFLLNFYRNPERKIPKGNNIVSPADGKIIRILKVKNDKIFLNKDFIQKVRD